VYVIGAAAIAGPSGVVAIVSGMTIGHMAGKVLLYFAGAGAIRMPLRESYKAKLASTRERLERSRLGTVPFLFVSAATGWPPFYVVAIMAGILRLGIWTFLIPGTVGRLARFTVVGLVPRIFTGG
jgi:membrane protein YqaA with SNARE-associated domain